MPDSPLATEDLVSSKLLLLPDDLLPVEVFMFYRRQRCMYVHWRWACSLAVRVRFRCPRAIRPGPLI